MWPVFARPINRRLRKAGLLHPARSAYWPSFVVHLSAEAARSLAIASGTAVEAVAVSGGWLLMAAGEALCFVADEHARAHVHSREIDT